MLIAGFIKMLTHNEKERNKMNKSKLLISSVAGACLLTLSACTTTGSSKKAKQAPVANSRVVVPGAVITEDGTLLFTASGESVAKAEDGALGVVKAKAAAAVVAKTNLLEVLKGAVLGGSTTVADLMFTSQSASSAVDGWLAGVVIESTVKAERKSNLPGAKEKDQIITVKASLEVSGKGWEALKRSVE
jgi:hypothetical protein